MTSVSSGRLGIGLVLLLAAAGCRRDQEAYGERRDQPAPPENAPAPRDTARAPEPSRPQAPAAVPQAVFDSALGSIAEARCDRELSCKQIGKGKKHETREACIAEMKRDKVEGLNVNDCPGGIDAKELAECIAEIKKEDCKNPIDTVSRLAACRSSDMCKATPPAGR